MENQLNEIREKLRQEASQSFMRGKINKQEFCFYQYYLQDPKCGLVDYSEALTELHAIDSSRIIDLDNNDWGEINIKHKGSPYKSGICFNATALLHAIVEDFTPEEVAQAIDQSMEFMIGYLAYAGWKMNDNLSTMYSTLRAVRNGIVSGYSVAVLNSVVQSKIDH